MIRQRQGHRLIESNWNLTAAIHLPEDRAIVAEEMVSESDLKGHLGEVWRDDFLREGLIEVSMDDLSFALEPIVQRKGSDQVCTGFRIEAAASGLGRAQRDFSVLSLDLVASRAASRLVATGALKVGDPYNYVIRHRRTVSTQGNLQHNLGQGSRPFTVTAKNSDSLRWIKASVAPLLERSASRQADAKQFPVFYTTSALAEAEGLARRGAQFDPPVETGAFLLGVLGSCPQSGELFAIVCEVIVLEGATQGRFSLIPSARTWQRLHEQMRQLAQTDTNRRLTVLGQCHGHNFLPGSCTSCERTATCQSTSTFVSMEDRLWNNAVLDSSPYQLCHIFGLTATGEKVDALYGLADGRLQQRGFYIIPDESLAAHLERLPA